MQNTASNRLILKQSSHMSSAEFSTRKDKQKPTLQQCCYYIETKRRQCGYRCITNSNYCRNHVSIAPTEPPTAGLFVRCPSGNHTIKITAPNSIEKHLKLCPDLIKLNSHKLKPYYKEAINAGPPLPHHHQHNQDTPSSTTVNNNINSPLPPVPPLLKDIIGHQDSFRSRRIAATIALGEHGFLSLLSKIDTAYHTLVTNSTSSSSSTSILTDRNLSYHPTLPPLLNHHHNSKSRKKAPDIQCNSIVANMALHGLLLVDNDEEKKGGDEGQQQQQQQQQSPPPPSSSSLSFIEFGAGKGYLSLALSDIFPTAKHYAMMDLTSPKLLADRFMRHLPMTRIKCDLADFEPTGISDLLRVNTSIKGTTTTTATDDDDNDDDDDDTLLLSPWVGLAKHLCGAATDLALRCCHRHLNTIRGLAIATCCHHRCTWQHFVGRELFGELGFSGEEFELISMITGYAVCGHDVGRSGGGGGEKDGGTIADENNAPALPPTTTTTHTTMAAVVVDDDDGTKSNSALPRPLSAALQYWRPHHTISREERMEWGLKCKRLIDAARMKWLVDNGFEGQIVAYIPSEMVGENQLLIVKKGEEEQEQE